MVCADPIYLSDERHMKLLNPQIVFEMLSASTTSVDLDEKFDDYTRIDSLQAYVVLAQDRAWGRSFIRGVEGR